MFGSGLILLISSRSYFEGQTINVWFLISILSIIPCIRCREEIRGKDIIGFLCKQIRDKVPSPFYVYFNIRRRMCR